MWGLIRAAGVYSLHHKIEHWYLEMAPVLAGLFAGAGFAVQQIGETKDPRGLRLPYYMSVENVLAQPLWTQDYKVNYQLYSGLSADAYYRLVAGYWKFFQQTQQLSRNSIKEFG